MSSAPLKLELPRGAYAERADVRLSWLDRQGDRLARAVQCRWRSRLGNARRVAAAAAALEGEFASLAEAQLDGIALSLRDRLRRERISREAVARTFALVREVARRRLGMRHHDVQLVGGAVLLDGMIAEMETGEGKTLTATLAAGVAALSGIPTHIVTVNDYLAARDARGMLPIYEAIGLSVGVIQHGMSPAERQMAYACDVTYCANKELVFDYLRDRIALGPEATRLRLQIERLRPSPRLNQQVVLRGLHFALVDEADSVLIDESRTPLIISVPAGDPGEERVYREALVLAGELNRGAHFVTDEHSREVRLTEAGSAHLSRAAEVGGVWQRRRRREDLVQMALTALHLLRKDVDYLVRDDKVHIIDEYTGRLMNDRTWEHGLHQMVEAKECAAITGRQDPRARISYQRFFQRYLRLAGMTGTAREVAGELAAVYRLPVVRIPTNRPLRRRDLGERVVRNLAEKHSLVVEQAASLHDHGRPILIGTTSVGESEALSERLREAGLPHRVLNARQDKDEAEIIAEAGQGGRITVATNMAGRGTDICLGSGVAALGGLHVIATARHDARRIDRQLFGRCGRQGDPGSFEAIVSLEDALFSVHTGMLGSWLARRGALAPIAVRAAQKRAEQTNSRLRRQLLLMDAQLDDALAFSGASE